MKAAEVYDSVRRFVSNHDHKFENVFLHGWEADSFSVTSSMYSYEIEVKVSRSDFFADFKKPKHHFFKNYKTGYGILNCGMSWRCEGWPVTDKIPELKDFKIQYTNIRAQKLSYKTAPNRFFFACPPDLIKPEEVPEYAGLIYCFPYDPKVVKKAPFIHKDMVNVKELLFDKYYWQHLEQKRTIRELEHIVKRLKGNPQLSI
jgi:hypothetical protein